MADLATIDGKSLEVFKSDPINDLLYSMGMEKQKNGLEIAQKGYRHYFVNNKESGYITKQYGQVYEVLKKSLPKFKWSHSVLIFILMITVSLMVSTTP